MTTPAPTRVLLVDDEPSLREPLAEYLARQGFIVAQADDAAKARTLLLDDTPDIVLLDIMMPGEDGLSLCRHLTEAKQLPVILLTARGEATDRIVGLEIGADDYVVKPFEPRELVARIRSVLRRSSKPAAAPGMTARQADREAGGAGSVIVSAPTRLLLVDDEPTLREPLAEYLTRQGFVVRQAEDASKARSLLLEYTPDLVLLDIMMPGEDGLSLCRHLTETKNLPVILLTAKGEPMDRIVGLEIGADDYVAKPFEPRELVARIRSVLRRSAKLPPVAEEDALFEFDGWKLDPLKRKLTDPRGAVVPISSAEFRLLVAFLTHPRQVLDRDQLLDMVQGREAHLFDRAVDNQVSRLRRKMEEDSREPKLIQTVWGGGYRLAADVRRVAAERD